MQTDVLTLWKLPQHVRMATMISISVARCYTNDRFGTDVANQNHGRHDILAFKIECSIATMRKGEL